MKGRIGFKCELYLVHPPAHWGSILAIRTGPADLGRVAMGRMLARGFKHQAGFVVRTSDRQLIPTPEEEDFFRCADLPCLPPAQRDAQAEALVAELRAAQARVAR